MTETPTTMADERHGDASDWRIRAADEGDLAAIIDLAHESNVTSLPYDDRLYANWAARDGETFAKCITDVDKAALVAVRTSDDRLVGILTADADDRDTGRRIRYPAVLIDFFFITAEYRGRGVDRALLERFHSWAFHEQGCPKVMYGHYHNNEAVDALLASQGWRLFSTIWVRDEDLTQRRGLPQPAPTPVGAPIFSPGNSNH